jgi:wobble nucleotide-excising tRNase
MFKKFIQLENIKQWQHKGGLDNEFDKLNLIYGRNGSGKSTLGQVFEYINENDASSITSLKPIENSGEAKLKFLMSDGNLNLSSLNTKFKFKIFDQTFIDDNLYTSKGTDSSQFVNYYDFSLGMVAVNNQKEIDQLKLINVELVRSINSLSTKIKDRFSGKDVPKIKKIKEVEDCDLQLEISREKLKDIKSVEHFKKRKKLSRIIVSIDDLDKSCFVTTIAKLSIEAQKKVDEHINKNLSERNNIWIEEGRNLVTENDNCPFCSQSLSESPIFHLYQEFMNETYLAACDEFELKSGYFELAVSSIGVTVEEQEEVVKSNIEIIREWSDRIPSFELNYDFSKQSSLTLKLDSSCREMIVEKAKDLLAVSDFLKFNELLYELSKLLDFSEYNELVDSHNEKIDSFVLGLGSENTSSIEDKIKEINESKIRYSSDVVEGLSKVKDLESEKRSLSKEITNLRDIIAKEQEESIGKHKNTINELLKSFNSMIRIKELIKDNKGYKGASRITYAITFIGRELSVINDNKKIFESVLSLGDRSSLALAFFLSRFKEKNIDGSIIVLDDPMSSLDEYRRNATVIEIGKLVDHEYQTFVLSHDPFFLSDILKYSILSKFTRCYEIDVIYTDLKPLDPESAQYPSSKLVNRADYESYVLHSYHKEYNKLFDFVSSGSDADKVEIARCIRPVLEAYLRFLFPKQFVSDIWLGDMIAKIREEKDESSPFYDKSNRFYSIEKINEFSKKYHHSEGFDTKIQSLDFQTVKSYAKETLCFITGL